MAFSLPEAAGAHSSYCSDYQKDRVERMTKMALSTAAAPTYFEALPNNGYVMVDGGLWANNPVMNALVDALACYDRPT
jgi:patatin-like phospholipase/acyl hydrolase